MATPSTSRTITAVWHNKTTQKTTVEVVDKATGKRGFYSKVTTTVTTGQEVLIDTTWESAQAPPPNMGNRDVRTSTMEETNQASSEAQKTKKSKKYSSKSWGLFGIKG